LGAAAGLPMESDTAFAGGPDGAARSKKTGGAPAGLVAQDVILKIWHEGFRVRGLGVRV